MSDRVRVAITTSHSVDGPARVASLDDVDALLVLLEQYGPEVEGVVVDADEEALAILPERWEVEELCD